MSYAASGQGNVSPTKSTRALMQQLTTLQARLASLEASVAANPPTISIPSQVPTRAAGAAASQQIVEQRMSTGALAANAKTQITLTWANPFADTNYSVVASVVDSNTALSIEQIVSYTTTAVTVNIYNAASVAVTGTLIVIAVHD